MKKLKPLLFLLLALGILCSPHTTSEAQKSSSGYRISLNRTVYTLKKGKSVTLKATLSKKAKKKGITWSSSNKKVAAVSSNGTVKAKKKGKTTIKAKINGTRFSAKCKLVVGTPVKKVKLNKTKLTLTAGSTYALKASVTPKKASIKKLTYKSSAKNVVTVSSRGILTAKNAGTAKITVSAADGSGAKAVCRVTVTPKTEVTLVTLDRTSLSMKPGESIRLTASASPADAKDKTITWSSTNPAVVSVRNDGTVTAVGEGIAQVRAAAPNGIYAACSIRSAYSSLATTQAELNLALSSKMNTEVKYVSDAKEDLVIPAGNYSSKVITLNAPNAVITNNGNFKKVVVDSATTKAYQENASNIVYYHSSKGKVVIKPGGNATINLPDKKGQAKQVLDLENNGNINSVNVPSSTDMDVKGNHTVPITLGQNAKDSTITSSAELDIHASSPWNMNILPGGENTKASVKDDSCMPSINGLGCIPVNVVSENELVNIPAEMNKSLNIDQKVAIHGNVQKIYLEHTAADDGTTQTSAVTAASENTKVYLLPYTTANSDMESKYADYIRDMDAAVTADTNGDYQIPDTQIGNYWMIYEKDGCSPVVKSLVITSSNTETYSDGTSNLLSEELAAVEPAGEISGTVINGLTGESVYTDGLRIKLRKGSGNITGAVIQETATDSSGAYSFQNVPAGIYTLEVIDLRQNLASDAVRYNHAPTDITVVPGYLSTDNYNCVVNPQMHSITGQGQVQFTLTWGNSESGASADIDSHLIGPGADGTPFHIYYSDPDYYLDGERYADLDVDDTDYEGPEHTTIYQETPGIYRFYIHNYSESDVENSDMLSKSHVQVRVTIGRSSYVYNCPKQTGNLWYVCDYNSVTHTILPRNQMSTFLDGSSYIGLTDEELNTLYLETKKEDARDSLDYYKRALTLYTGNAAKATYQTQADTWTAEIEQASNFRALRTLSSEIEEAAELLDSPSYPYLSADHMQDYYYNICSIYDDDDNETGRYVKCSAELLFDTISNFSAEPGEEGDTVTFEPLENAEDGCIYLIHVTQQNGLAYDIRVMAVTGEAQNQLLTHVQSLRYDIGMYDSNERLNEILTRLDVIESQIPSLNDETVYNTLREELTSLTLELSTDAFVIDTLDSSGHIADWWTSTSDIYDDNDNQIGSRAVLRIERDCSATDQDILGKLEPIFWNENVTYTITVLDSGEYQGLLKVTDPSTGFTKNIYIKITEY